MEVVRDADFRRVIEFIEEAWAFAGDQPFTRGTLDALERLIRSDVLAYSELDRVDRRDAGRCPQKWGSEACGSRSCAGRRAVASTAGGSPAGRRALGC